MAFTPPFGRIILPILLTLSTPFILTGTLASPSKKLIDLDISERRQCMVRTMPSEAYPGGIHYSAMNGPGHTCILGTIRDGQEILIERDPTAVSRYILVRHRGDGGKYVRIITRWRILINTYGSHVDEFVRRAEDAHYSRVTRTPIEVDLLTQDIDQNVHVELLGDWEEHDRRPGVMPDNIEDMPMLFTVHKHVMDEVMIGMVRYGHHILENGVDGLMSREVIWEGGVEKPIITITSRYTDGTKVTTKHKFYRRHKRFKALASAKRFVGLRE